MTAAAVLALLLGAAGAQEVDTVYLLPGSTEALSVPLRGGPSDALLEVEAPKALRLVAGTDLGPRAGEEGALFRIVLQAVPSAKPGERSFEVRARRLSGGGVLWRRRMKAVVFAPGPGAARASALPPAAGVKCWELGPSRVCAPDGQAILRHHARRYTGDLAHAARVLGALEERAGARETGGIGAVDAHDVLGALEAGYGAVLASMTALGRLSPEALSAVQEELAREGLTPASARAARARAASRQGALRRRHPVLGRADAGFERLLAVERAEAPEASTAALVMHLARQPIRRRVRLEAMAALPEAGGDPAESARFLLDLAFPPGLPPPPYLDLEEAAVLDLLPRFSTAATAALTPRLAALLDGLGAGHELAARALIGVGTPEAWEAVDGFERERFRSAAAVPAGGWQGFASAIETPGAVVAREPAHWAELWARHRPGRPAPEVDFETQLVAGVFLGPAAGRGLRLEAVERSSAAVTVVFSWEGPESSPYPSAAFSLAKLPATRLPVRVVARWKPDERSPARESVLFESPGRN